MCASHHRVDGGRTLPARQNRLSPIPGALLALPALLSILLILAAPALAQESCGGIWGDVNGDGSVDIVDAQQIARFAVELPVADSELAGQWGDVNDDGSVDIIDAQQTARHAVGLSAVDRIGLTATCESCGVPVLATSSALPLATVELTGVPEDFSSTMNADVRAAASDDSTVAFVWRDDEGTVRMAVPVHPTGDPDGGDVELVIGDGTSSCESVPFTIEALPAAEGTATAVVDALQESLDLLAGRFGYTSSDLRATDLSALPEHLYPLALAQSVLDDPDNPNTLRKLAGGSAPLLTEGTVDVTLTDRLLARTGVLEALTSFNEELAASGSAFSDPASAELAARSADGGAAASVLSECASVSTAAELDYCMDAQLEAEFKLSGESATGEVLGDLGTATGLAGAIPFPPAKLAAAGAGLASWLLQVYRRALAGLLPSEFDQPLTVTFTETSFEEDAADPGEWTDAMALAKSAGWTLDKTAMETVIQGIGVKGAKGAYDDWLNRFAPADVVGDVIAGLAGFVDTQTAQWLVNHTTTDIIHLPSKNFGPVDVTAETWTDKRLSGSTFVVEFTDHHHYIPREVGSSEIVVETKVSEFGGATPAEGRGSVIVRAIDLTFDPAEVVMKRGEQRDFTLQVENSAFPEKVEVESPTGRASLASFDAGAKSHTVTYTAPSSPDAFPELVSVRHTAETGARRPSLSPPPRVGFATVRLPQVRVTPLSECVDRGATHPFQAEVVGLENQEVTWDASAGDIGSTGPSTATFQAPSTTQTVTITATSVEDPELQGRAVARVGGCDCWWTLTALGEQWTGQAGSAVSFGRDPDTGDLEAAAVASDNTAAADFIGAVPPGETGVFPVDGTAGGDLFGTDNTKMQSDDPFTTGTKETWTLTLGEHTGDVLEGKVDGVAWYQDRAADEWRTTTIDWRFRYVDDPSDDIFQPPDVNQCTVQ